MDWVGQETAPAVREDVTLFGKNEIGLRYFAWFLSYMINGLVLMSDYILEIYSFIEFMNETLIFIILYITTWTLKWFCRYWQGLESFFQREWQNEGNSILLVRYKVLTPKGAIGDRNETAATQKLLGITLRQHAPDSLE